MKFFTDLDRSKYDSFVQQHHQKSHFLQSRAWGEFNENRGNPAHFLGLESEEGILRAATLLIEKKLTGSFRYFYAPRGFVLDYDEYNLLEDFTRHVRDYVKTRRGIFIKIDPDIILHEIDEQAGAVEGGANNYALFERLCRIGFRHRGFNRNFESSQPRFTFRISLGGPADSVTSRISKSFMQSVRVAQKYAVEVSIGTAGDLDRFFDLLLVTGCRDNILTYSKDYYAGLYEILDRYGMVFLFLGRVYPDRIIGNHRSLLAEARAALDSEKKPGKVRDLHDRIAKINRELESYSEFEGRYPGGLVISAHFVVVYGAKAWEVYAGSEDIFRETCVNNLVHYRELLFAREKGLEVFDLFGTTGDLTPGNPLLGIHNYKKKLGGDYIEFMGEFDLVTRRLLYFIYSTLIPLYRAVKRKVAMMRRRAIPS